VRDGVTMKEVFDRIVSKFERKGLTNRLYLRKKLIQMRYHDTDSLQEHFITFYETVRSLKACGSNIKLYD